MYEHVKILLVGGGKMGSALMAGWLKAGFDAETMRVVEPSRAPRLHLKEDFGLKVLEHLEELEKDYVPDVLVLAVKPQAMDEILAAYAKLGWHKTLFLTIAAGRTIASLKKHLGAKAAVVRAMPNLPATIGRGITVMIGSDINGFQRELAYTMLKAAGDVIWTDDEGQMDAVTAVSGSGPAYLFHFIEAFTDAAKAAGLDDEMARKLVEKTVVGSAELLLQSGAPAHVLRESVTSPGGTTEAALTTLMDKDKGLKTPLIEAVLKAKNRARELSS